MKESFGASGVSVISGLVSNSGKSKPVWSNEPKNEKSELVSHGLVVVTLGKGENSSRRCFLMKKRADVSLGVAIREQRIGGRWLI